MYLQPPYKNGMATKTALMEDDDDDEDERVNRRLARINPVDSSMADFPAWAIASIINAIAIWVLGFIEWKYSGRAVFDERVLMHIIMGSFFAGFAVVFWLWSRRNNRLIAEMDEWRKMRMAQTGRAPEQAPAAPRRQTRK